VALKRQQAAEDAVAIGLRTIVTGNSVRALPPGPIFGMRVEDASESEIQIAPESERIRHQNAEIPKPSKAGSHSKRSESVSESKYAYNEIGNPGGNAPIPPSPKDILKKLFPSYEEALLDQVLLQNDQNLVKTIHKLSPQPNHHHSRSGKEIPTGSGNK